MSDKIKVGYNGQRYEIYAQKIDGVEIRLGWTNKADGGAFKAMLDKHPVWHSMRIVDLKPETTEPKG